ncbi:hypothetical protein P8452_73695 [Trifolium repens]|nr:hypothetical protein P8452_73695 [Trifolium repens]
MSFWYDTVLLVHLVTLILKFREQETQIKRMMVIPIIERGDIQNVVDPRLEGEFSINSAWKLVEIAMSCTSPNAVERPDMSLILAELKECLSLDMVQRNRGKTRAIDELISLATISETTILAR